MAGGVATAERAAETKAFASAGEMREVLTRMRAAHVSHRYVFPDLGLTLNVAGSDDDDQSIRWSFSEDPQWEPKVTLEMSSDIANRYLQGRENLAIALARGRIRCSCEASAALSLLPINRPLNACYRDVLERHYPHLLLSRAAGGSLR